MGSNSKEWAELLVALAVVVAATAFIGLLQLIAYLLDLWMKYIG